MDNEQFDCETRNRLQILVLPSSSCGLNDIDYISRLKLICYLEMQALAFTFSPKHCHPPVKGTLHFPTERS